MIYAIHVGSNIKDVTSTDTMIKIKYNFWSYKSK